MITEADTCRNYVLPKLYSAGWTNEQISEQKSFTDGQVIVTGTSTQRGKKKRADYLLRISRNYPIAVVEAKAAYKQPGDGLQQAKDYAKTLDLRFAYSTNGHRIIEYDDITHIEREIDKFPTSEELWKRLKKEEGITDDIGEKILEPFHHIINKIPRYYQEIAINRTIKEIYRGRKRMLLTLATGTGKTTVAFQIIWKIWNQRWNRAGEYRRPKILYLADRNVLIDNPKDNEFTDFGDARWKIQGEANKSRDVYFAIYQAIAADENRKGLYKEYSPDFFDLIVVDECHRGSAKDESNWREILDYFVPAVKLGMTATPLRTDNVDTYQYFGNPLYTYTLRQGIEDGFLAPYRVHRIVSSVDATGYRPYKGQKDRFGREIPAGVYETPDFERTISFRKRTEAVARHLTEYMKKEDRLAKTIVFCVDQEHADEMRRALANTNADLLGKYPDYVVRITSEEGEIGKGFLSKFMDIETIEPVIATTSKLLTTGVNIPTCKNIVIFATINSMTEFKQIIGRGTRIREDYGKLFFTILDYTGSATRLFADPDFDGEPIILTEEEIDENGDPIVSKEPVVKPTPQPDPNPCEKWRPKISNDDEGRIRKYYVDDLHVEITTELVYELDSSGNRLRTIEFTDYTREQVSKLFSSYDALRSHWTTADERKAIVESLGDRGISFEHLAEVTKRPDADPFDLLCHVAYNTPIRTRKDRAEKVLREKKAFFEKYSLPAREILQEILGKYTEFGFDQIDNMNILKVPPISRHGNLLEIAQVFGGVPELKKAITDLQTMIYA
jgi:type I restriction enzyme R subunit